MPPIPPARRQPAAVVAAKPLSPKHRRFLWLLGAHPAHPSQGLGPARVDALPQSCRDALALATTMPFLDDASRAALEAYYASGHQPSHTTQDPYWWGDDLHRALRLMEAPAGDIALFLSMFPALSDGNVLLKLMALLSAPELKAGEKIRLEALRLVAELKGWRRDDQAAAVQATQIVIHTASEPAIQAHTEPKRIDIEL